jgi:hypothetical protein
MAVALSKHQITPRPRENINTLVKKKKRGKRLVIPCLRTLFLRIDKMVEGSSVWAVDGADQSSIC